MFTRSKRIARSYWESKRNEYNRYLGMPEVHTSPYTMESPNSLGDRGAMNARYAGKGPAGQSTAKAYGQMQGILHNLDTVRNINHEVSAEHKEARSRNRRNHGPQR